MAGDWRRRAACRDDDPELFYPTGTAGPALVQIELAKAICCRCPVVEECGEYALESNQEYGVWGAMSEDERRAIRRAGTQRTPNPKRYRMTCAECQQVIRRHGTAYHLLGLLPA